jgi:hypothetical protein
VYTTGVLDAAKISPATELFNFPNDTAWGATCDSLRILVHARYNDAAGDCSVEAGDSVRIIYDTNAAAGYTRLSKFALTTSWATYTSSPIIAPSKAAMVQLQAGFRNYAGSCSEGTILDKHEVAWIAVERFFATTNKRVKVGNVRPLTVNDSTWIEVYYTDVSQFHANPGVGASEKVINFKDTTDILMGQLDGNTTTSTANDGLYGLNVYQIGQAKVADSFRQCMFVLRDTSVIADSFPSATYKIDSAKINLYVGTLGVNVTTAEFHPVFRGWRPDPKRYREAVFPSLPLTITARATSQTPYSDRRWRKVLTEDTIRSSVFDTDTALWSICGSCTGSDGTQVDERVPSDVDYVLRNQSAGNATEMFEIEHPGGVPDTVTWDNKPLVLPDSFCIVVRARFTLSPAAGDSLVVMFDTVVAAGQQRVFKPALTTSFVTYRSQPIVPTRNIQFKYLQAGGHAYLPQVNQEVQMSWIAAVRYFPKEKDSTYWRTAGAVDSTTVDSADVAASIDTLTWDQAVPTDQGKYCDRINVTAWIDSMQHGYGTQTEAAKVTKKWGNAIKIKVFATQSGSAASRQVQLNSIYPRQNNPLQATELHVWATDTTTAVGGIKPRRRKLIETGEVDSLPPATLPSWERETRKIFVEKK